MRRWRKGTRGGTVDVMERLVVVRDPDLGTIAATIDAEGSVLSTAADDWLPPANMQPYLEAADLAAREGAALYAQAFPEHDAWIRRAWDDCIAEGGAR